MGGSPHSRTHDRPKVEHAELINKLEPAPSKTMRRMDHRLHSLYFTSATPSGIFEVQGTIFDRRIGMRSWD